MDVVPRRSDRRGLVQLGAHVAALVVAERWLTVAHGLAMRAVATVVSGMILVFLFCAAHECVHRTAFKRRWCNDAVAAAVGALLLLPSRWFRFFHAAHHRWTQDPELDPELAGRDTDSGVRDMAWRLSGGAYWLAMARVVTRLARGWADERWIPSGHRRAVEREGRALVGVYALVAVVSVVSHSTFAVWHWVLPALVGQPFLRAYLIVEHGLCPLAEGPLAGTRTTLTNPVVRLLAWNMPYHAEHHAHPQGPFHQLPALHRGMAGRLLVVDRGYVRTVARVVRGQNRRSSSGFMPRSSS